VPTAGPSSGFDKVQSTGGPFTSDSSERTRPAVDAAYAAAIAAGATDNGAPGARMHYDPRYYAANVFDPDGYSLEFVYKSWQHVQS
jgi:predicted lactoylglutathione lyase